MADKYITETTTKLKPDGSTYREWCMKTRAMINQQKLGKYLKKVRMEDGQYPSGYNEEDDLCALAHIQQSIHADHLKFVKDTATTYETWESLKAIYESVSEVNLVTLQLQMSKLEWGERNGLDSFADQFNESMSKIAVAGDSTPDKAHLTRFLRTGTAYDSMVSMLAELKLDDERQRLHDPNLAKRASQMDEALTVSPNDYRYCGKTGHYQAECQS
ncbi:unnamed protein product [Aphanomyces euteiches]|nr:hypothetical protein Ae201684P_019924 [Aphanomyces euteiches]